MSKRRFPVDIFCAGAECYKAVHFIIVAGPISVGVAFLAIIATHVTIPKKL